VKKLPAKFLPIAMAFWMSLLFSFLMSGLITIVNTGLAGDFVVRWMHAWSIAFPCAFLVSLLIRPVVSKLVAYTVQAPGDLKSE
jgi:hypothetical protein